ncbi:MAG: hypothetical protein ACI9LX_002092 [Paraglaciecola sp.]|jgi:hypothetical protein
MAFAKNVYEKQDFSCELSTVQAAVAANYQKHCVLCHAENHGPDDCGYNAMKKLKNAVFNVIA